MNTNDYANSRIKLASKNKFAKYDGSTEFINVLNIAAAARSANEEIAEFSFDFKEENFIGGHVVNAYLQHYSTDAQKPVNFTILLYSQQAAPGPNWLGSTSANTQYNGGAFDGVKIPFAMLRFDSTADDSHTYTGTYTILPSGSGSEVTQTMQASNIVPSVFDLKPNDFGTYAVHGVVVTENDITITANDNFTLSLHISY